MQVRRGTTIWIGRCHAPWRRRHCHGNPTAVVAGALAGMITMDTWQVRKTEGRRATYSKSATIMAWLARIL
jgi:hypothetical protein